VLWHSSVKISLTPEVWFHGFSTNTRPVRVYKEETSHEDEARTHTIDEDSVKGKKNDTARGHGFLNAFGVCL
jgi:hypothetical protein